MRKEKPSRRRGVRPTGSMARRSAERDKPRISDHVGVARSRCRQRWRRGVSERSIDAWIFFTTKRNWIPFCWATVYKTVRPMLSVVLSCLSVTLMHCATNGWMDQDANWDGGRPQPWSHCVRRGSSFPQKGTQQLPFSRFTDVRINRGPCALWPNGWMHHDATWYGGRPRPR